MRPPAIFYTSVVLTEGLFWVLKVFFGLQVNRLGVGDAVGICTDADGDLVVASNSEEVRQATVRPTYGAAAVQHMPPPPPGKAESFTNGMFLFQNPLQCIHKFQSHMGFSCLRSIRSAGSDTQEWACLVAWAAAVTHALASLAASQRIKNKLCILSLSFPISSVLLFKFFYLLIMLMASKKSCDWYGHAMQRYAWWRTGAPGRCSRSPCCTKFAGHSGFCSGPRALNESNGAARLRHDEPEEPTDQLHRRSSGNATTFVIRLAS